MQQTWQNATFKIIKEKQKNQKILCVLLLVAVKVNKVYCNVYEIYLQTDGNFSNCCYLEKQEIVKRGNIHKVFF